MPRIAVFALGSLALGRVALLVALPLTAQHTHAPAGAQPEASETREQRVKSNTKGEVEFRAETMLGELRLAPGRYRIEHRLQGDDHLVHFTRVSEGPKPSPDGDRAAKAEASDLAIRCRVEPVEKKGSLTVFTLPRDGKAWVTRVRIAEETIIDCR